MKKLLAIAVGIIAIAPSGVIVNIPITAHSFVWRYLAVSAGFFAVLLLWQEIHWSLKALALYLFGSCFISQLPFFSFNALIVLVAAFYIFIFAKKMEFDFFLKVIEAVFWFQVIMLVMQHFGVDTLLSFDKQEKCFYGTIFQPMRLGSLFSIMAPFLLVKNKWYIFPLLILSICSETLGFSLALIAGTVIYFVLEMKDGNYEDSKLLLCLLSPVIAIIFGICVYRSWPHIAVEWVDGRMTIWPVILQTWCFDTMKNFHGFTGPRALLNPSPQAGPFSPHYFLFGHGLDTFLQLFPFYKYDPNPFGQCHNDWLQLLWEIGVVGCSIFSCYCVYLLSLQYKRKDNVCFGGLIIVGVNMFFAFPIRMFQSVLLLLIFIAFCEQRHKGVFHGRLFSD